MDPSFDPSKLVMLKKKGMLKRNQHGPKEGNVETSNDSRNSQAMMVSSSANSMGITGHARSSGLRTREGLSSTQSIFKDRNKETSNDSRNSQAMMVSSSANSMGITGHARSSGLSTREGLSSTQSIFKDRNKETSNDSRNSQAMMVSSRANSMGITGHARSSGLSTREGLSSTQMQLIDAPGDYVGSSQRTYSTTPNGDSSALLMSSSHLEQTCFDLTDRMILCASSHGSEIAVGSANHSVYAMNVDDAKKKPTEMYGKSFGHTDWVTDVCHLADGRVVSCGMDSKMCLWSVEKRNAIEVYAHRGSISKLAADRRYNLAVSCGYDRAICLWKFPPSMGRSRNIDGPFATLTGHSAPVLSFHFHEALLTSGARDGSVNIWNMQTCKILQKFKGHTAPISTIKSCVVEGSDDNTFLSTGADGYIKLWDYRVRNAVLATNPHGSAAVNEVVQLGGGYIVSGGADSKLCVLDLRRELEVVTSYDHCKNCVYSLCAVGEGCVFAGDGVGMLYCYDINGKDSGEIGLKYGVGASEQGAVRCLLSFDSGDKIAACGEDGKILVLKCQRT